LHGAARTDARELDRQLLLPLRLARLALREGDAGCNLGVTLEQGIDRRSPKMGERISASADTNYSAPNQQFLRMRTRKNPRSPLGNVSASVARNYAGGISLLGRSQYENCGAVELRRGEGLAGGVLIDVEDHRAPRAGEESHVVKLLHASGEFEIPAVWPVCRSMTATPHSSLSCRC
jgi:hypothetical protein